MKAVTWQGKRDVRVEDVPDPTIQEPTDAIIKVTSTNICGSDLHLYETLGPFMDAGQVREQGMGGCIVRIFQAVRTGTGGQAEYLRVPKLSSRTSWFRKDRWTSVSYTSRTSCPPFGSRCSTRTFRPAVRHRARTGADR